MVKSNISGAKQRQIKAAVAEIVGSKLATLTAEAGDRLIAKLTAFGEHVEPGIKTAIDQFSALPPVVLKLVNASVQLDAIASYDPSGLKTRKGLWVSDDFHRRVGSKAKPVNDVSAITLTSGDLVKNAYDKEIKADPVMPANHVFESESEFVAHLDQMIQKQPNGEEGDLNNEGYWNIFYVAGCVVNVRWDSDFRANVVAKTGRASVGATVGRSFDLTRNAYDREIERDPQLGEDYIFTETEVCARIKQMTEKQPNGEEGELLNNGFANIFYLAGCVVSVCWLDGDRKWSVYAWERGDDQWRAGNRVFSRNCF